MMKTNYRTINECCGRCQFVQDSPFLSCLKCGHPDNVWYDRMLKRYVLQEVNENGICDRFIKPYTITEEKFNKIYDKTKEKLARNYGK